MSNLALVPKSLDEVGKLAQRLSGSKLLPTELRAQADIAVTILQGLELGLAPMQAIRSIHVVKGKPVLSADLIAALVMRSPECVYFRLEKSSDTVATYTTLRKRHPEPVTLSYSIIDAKRAGLTSRDNWKKYPDAMLRARAKAALAREVYPEFAMGLYDPDEMRSAAADDGAVAAEVVHTDVGPMKVKRETGSMPVHVPYHYGSEERASDNAEHNPLPDWAGGDLPKCEACGAQLSHEGADCDECGLCAESEANDA